MFGMWLSSAISGYQSAARRAARRTSVAVAAVPSRSASASHRTVNRPATELVAGTPVRVDNGIVVDDQCRTNVPGIFAAGDVANHHHPVCGRQIRVEHWQNGVKQGAAAARSMLGRSQSYDEVHWFWSDQFDANIQYAGFHADWDTIVVRGSLAERKFLAFYLADGRVESVVAINQGRDLRRTLPIIKARVRVDPARLADPTVDLRTLAPASA